MRSNTFTYCIIVVATILITKLIIEEYSSPVEEMYHRQLVVTIDSILNARFDTDCCKEDTYTVNTNTFNIRFSGILSSMECYKILYLPISFSCVAFKYAL